MRRDPFSTWPRGTRQDEEALLEAFLEGCRDGLEESGKECREGTFGNVGEDSGEIPRCQEEIRNDVRESIPVEPGKKYSWGKNGRRCREFAARYAGMCGTAHCIPVANGTVSIELILRGLGIGYGDEVILPAYTFIATMSAVVFAGAVPVFADIEPGTYNLCADSVEQHITSRTRAVLAVAVGGRPCDFEKLEAVTKKHGIYLVVDAAQAAGARFLDRSVGKYGVAASFSCQNSKNLTCGEGGIITTDSDSLRDAICTMLGIEGQGHTAISDKTLFPRLDHGLTEMQAALLMSQLDKLPGEIYLRGENVAYLEGRLKGNPLLLPMEQDPRIQVHAEHVHLMRVNTRIVREYGLNREDLLQALHAEGIPLQPGYQPLYAFPCTTSPEVAHAIGREIDCTPLPVCERAGYEEGVWFYHGIFLGRRRDMDQIADGVDKVWENLEALGAAKRGTGKETI